MSTAVRDAANAVRVAEHLLDDAKITGAVVFKRMQKNVVAIVTQHELQREIERVAVPGAKEVLADVHGEVRG